MQFFITVTTLLMAASSAIAATPSRRQAAADTKVRVILRDDAGDKQEIVFAAVNSNVAQGALCVAGIFSTLEVDVGSDAQSSLRCSVTGVDQTVRLFARRGANLDDTFSDSTNGEWTFDGPTLINTVRCDPAFVADNRNAA
ncbi:hypothetical protein LTR17_017244 [Elasticomyces elasticus]|nr:hypothetical protein LTR17_017244 [Elasticomyces elasticus]